MVELDEEWYILSKIFLLLALAAREARLNKRDHAALISAAVAACMWYENIRHAFHPDAFSTQKDFQRCTILFSHQNHQLSTHEQPATSPGRRIARKDIPLWLWTIVCDCSSAAQNDDHPCTQIFEQWQQ